MTVNRHHFQAKMGLIPPWNCPSCVTGTLKELPKERVLVQPQHSKIEQKEDWWEPEHMIQQFSARMECTDPTCGECVFVIGRVVTDYYGHDEEGAHYYEELEPRAAFPAIPVFRLRSDWPKPVVAELRRSFASIWNDPGASANRLRSAVECLLDDLKVKKTLTAVKGGKKRRSHLNLHDRILAFGMANQEAAELLLAIKWLGNAGSHADLIGISRDAVLDGMEIMEHVLHLLFDKTGTAVAKLASMINKKKGPIVKARKNKL